MNEDKISKIFFDCMHCIPQKLNRCAVGIGNYVYIIQCDDNKYVFRCSAENNAYTDTVYWLNKLAVLDIPIPKILFKGKQEEYEYIILNYLEGKDIGLVYHELNKSEKKKIAKAVMEIQRKVSQLPLEDIDATWRWETFVDEMLERADMRIRQNGYFDHGKVEQLRKQKVFLTEYFSNVKPLAYLDDISTKNLLVHNGQLSGVIDIDWMGVGDDLTFIAMTYIALLNMSCETDYVDYLLEERSCNAMEKKAFLFYSLLFCVDFMGERGMQFGDKKIEVNEAVVNRMNQMYEDLWGKWSELQIS